MPNFTVPTNKISVRRTAAAFSLQLFIFLSVSLDLSAQNRYIDSLHQVLRTANLPDTSWMEVMMNIGNFHAPDNPELAEEKYRMVYKKAEEKKRPYFIGMALCGMGKLHGDNSDSSLYYFQVADSFFSLVNTQAAKESRASNKASIADVRKHRKDFENAIVAILEAISIMEQSNAKNKWLVLGVLNSNMATIYHDLRQFDKALEYDLAALGHYRKRNTDPSYIIIAELFVASDYKDLDKMDSAKFHIDRALEMTKGLPSPDLNYRVFNALGGYYRKTTGYAEAVSAYKKAMGFAQQTKNTFRQMNCNRMLGFIYMDLKHYDTSLAYMEKALAQTRELKNKMLEIELLKNIAIAQGQLGRFKESASFYETYVRETDSLQKQEISTRVNEIENKYQATKKRDSISSLQLVNGLQKSQLKQQETINTILAIGSAMLLIIAVLSYTNFKNRNRLLLQNKKLHSREISQLEQEKKLLAAQYLMKGQEEERSRLARDLHDGIGGLLSGVKFSMSSALYGNVFLSEEAAGSFERLIAQLDHSIVELRRVSHNMMPDALISYGLKEALCNYCTNLSQSGRLEIELQTYGLENRMDQSVEIVIYRLMQELLNNVVKHAQAKKVLAQLVRDGERFTLTVEDDGKGFDVNAARQGAGLANIQARTAYLNGTMDIVSKEGEGTSVYIEGSCKI